MRNGIAKKLENFASKNTREFILRRSVHALKNVYKLMGIQGVPTELDKFVFDF